MRIYPLSDLHLEFNEGTRYEADTGNTPVPAGIGPAAGVDVLIAAGDIHLGTRAPGWLRKLYRAVDRIIYVPGNHEYYHHRLDQLDDQLRLECQRHDIDFLQCDTLEFNGVVFLGCTLWTDFAAYAPLVGIAKAGRMAEGALADYRAIQIMSRSKNQLRRITWRDTEEIHKRHQSWLETEIERHRGKPLVVITHHIPSLSLCHPDFRTDPLTAAFCNRLGNLVERSEAKYWICGHSHYAMQLQIGRTLVVNNSLGYPGETANKRFDDNLMLEI